jgi:hypothetical protein
VRSIVGGTAVASGTASVDYAAWQHLAMVRTDSSNVYLYKDGSQSTASNQAVGGRSAAIQLDVGNGRAGTTPLNGRLYAIKAWTAALTTAEIALEMRSVRPVRLANLWGWWPARPGATERLIEYSGNGRSWTEVGTLSDEDPPPVWWGARSGSKAAVPAAPVSAIPRAAIVQTPLAIAPSGVAQQLFVIRAIPPPPPDRLSITPVLLGGMPVPGAEVRFVGTVKLAPVRLALIGVQPGQQPIPGALAIPIGRAKPAPTDRVAPTRLIPGQYPVAGAVSVALPGSPRQPVILFPWGGHTFAVAADQLTSLAKRTYSFAVAADDRSSQAKRTRTFIVAADSSTSGA